MKTWLAWIADSLVHRRENEGGRNYWDVYLEEIADRLGVGADRIEATAADQKTLGAYQAILLGAFGGNAVPTPLSNTLYTWVRQGGLLLAFATQGLDEGLVLESFGPLHQKDDYAKTADLSWDAGSRLSTNLRLPEYSERPLPCHAPVRRVKGSQGIVHASLTPIGYSEERIPAFVERTIGKGKVVYCTFDLPKAMWVLHQGRPVITQPSDDGFYRADTLSVYRDEQTVPAADELILFLRNCLADSGQPFLSPLPPMNEQSADLLCYWGGDDEGIAGTHRRAAEFMHAHGLPYHSNILCSRDGTFTITRAEAEELERLGTEVSLHYNFHDVGPHPSHFTRDEVRQQAAAFRETFGRAPGCTVNHWSLWTGWHQPAAWMAEMGGKGDNSFIPLQGERPCYRFGTSLPYRFYADHTGENARFSFVAQPGTCYEPLYGIPNNMAEGADPPDREEQAVLLRRSVDVTAHYNGAIDFFIHTYRLADWPASRGAVEFVLSCLREQGLRAVHLGNDALCDWWEARTQSYAVVSSIDPGEKRLQVRAVSPHGVTVLLPIAGKGEVRLPGCRATWRTREAFGRSWLEVSVPQGEHEIRVRSGTS